MDGSEKHSGCSHHVAADLAPEAPVKDLSSTVSDMRLREANTKDLR